MTERWIGLRPWQRHSQVLAVAGFVYLVFGVLLMTIPRTPAQRSSMRLALELLPMKVWAVPWIIVGLLALASTRWPPQSKTWGYTALSALAGAWASIYLLGVVFLGAPISTLSGTLVWGLVGFMWWAISGLMNPDDLVVDAEFLARSNEKR